MAETKREASAELARVVGPLRADIDTLRDLYLTQSQQAALDRVIEAALSSHGGGGEATYGVIDPDYARVFTIARCIAWSEGYMLAMHGSFTRDLDLIAVPWTDHACEPGHLMRRIEDAAGLNNVTDEPGQKPHGRLVWTLMFPGFSDPRFVDLGIMPPPQPRAEGMVQAFVRDFLAEYEEHEEEEWSPCWRELGERARVIVDAPPCIDCAYNPGLCDTHDAAAPGEGSGTGLQYVGVAVDSPDGGLAISITPPPASQSATPSDELPEGLEWRWVDDAGRAMTNWSTAAPPPVLDLSDAKGTMHVEVRVANGGAQ